MANLFGYFDLNKRLERQTRAAMPSSDSSSGGPGEAYPFEEPDRDLDLEDAPEKSTGAAVKAEEIGLDLDVEALGAEAPPAATVEDAEELDYAELEAFLDEAPKIEGIEVEGSLDLSLDLGGETAPAGVTKQKEMGEAAAEAATPTRITPAPSAPVQSLPEPTPLSPPRMPLWEQLSMYLGTVIGVLFSSAIMQYKTGELGALMITMPTVVISAVIALVIIPVVFEKLNIKPDAPLLVRLGLFVQHGVFWQVLLSAVGKAFSSG